MTDFCYEISPHDAMLKLNEVLIENEATVDDIFGLCVLIPSLLPVIRGQLENKKPSEEG